MTISEEFSRDNIIINLANYEMYYQVSLGFIVTTTNSKEHNGNIELQYALGSIYELITQIVELENPYEIFDNELKKQAAMDALQFFANQNLELVKNKTLNIENLVNDINDNKFFNDRMNKICDENRDTQLKKWSQIIDENLAMEIYNSVLNLQAN